MLEQLLQTVVQYADSAMVGQLGAQATAAVGLTTPVNWLVNSPMFAMGVGFLAWHLPVPWRPGRPHRPGGGGPVHLRGADFRHGDGDLPWDSAR